MNGAPYDYHDPYREVEQYLLKAEEEIGKAFEELQECESVREGPKPKNYLCPPPCPERKTPKSYVASFAARISKELASRGQYGQIPFQNWSSTWHPGAVRSEEVFCSNTFPGRSSNHRPADIQTKFYDECPNESTAPEVNLPQMTTRTDFVKDTSTPNVNYTSLDSDTRIRRRKFQRSLSDIGPTPSGWLDGEDGDDDVFPRPPSGDVSLLSIWADDLVRQLDQKMDTNAFENGHCQQNDIGSSQCSKVHSRPLLVDNSLAETFSPKPAICSRPVCKFNERFWPTNTCSTSTNMRMRQGSSCVRHVPRGYDAEICSKFGGRRASYPSNDGDKHGLFLDAFNEASFQIRYPSNKKRCTKDSAVQTGEDGDNMADRLVITRLQEDVADRIVVTNFQDGSTVESVTKDDPDMKNVILNHSSEDLLSKIPKDRDSIKPDENTRLTEEICIEKELSRQNMPLTNDKSHIRNNNSNSIGNSSVLLNELDQNKPNKSIKQTKHENSFDDDEISRQNSSGGITSKDHKVESKFPASSQNSSEVLDSSSRLEVYIPSKSPKYEVLREEYVPEKSSSLDGEVKSSIVVDASSSSKYVTRVPIREQRSMSSEYFSDTDSTYSFRSATEEPPGEEQDQHGMKQNQEISVPLEDGIISSDKIQDIASNGLVDSSSPLGGASSMPFIHLNIHTNNPDLSTRITNKDSVAAIVVSPTVNQEDKHRLESGEIILRSLDLLEKSANSVADSFNEQMQNDLGSTTDEILDERIPPNDVSKDVVTLQRREFEDHFMNYENYDGACANEYDDRDNIPLKCGIEIPASALSVKMNEPDGSPISNHKDGVTENPVYSENIIPPSIINNEDGILEYMAKQAGQSCSTHVSPHELEFFMRGVESSAYQPPPTEGSRTDPVVDIRKDKTPDETAEDQTVLVSEEFPDRFEATDAVTQTSPQLSRSSSFTWVTECDCSEWDLSRSGFETSSASEESLPTYSSSGLSGDSENNTDFCTADSSSSVSITSGGDQDQDQHTMKNRVPKPEVLSTKAPPSCKEASNRSLLLSNFSRNAERDLDKHGVRVDLNVQQTNKSAPVTPTGDRSCSDKTATLDITPSSSTTLSGSDTLNSTSENLLETKSDSGIAIHAYQRHPAADSPTKSLPKSVTLKPLDLSTCATSSSLGRTRKLKHLGTAHGNAIWNNVKSSSAPLLPPHANVTSSAVVNRRGTSQTTANSPVQEDKILIPPRSQSVKELSELEALEACAWLRAAGFPQYAQMYEDNLFPIDISSVQKDHEFLDSDSIQSLFRRLYTLNKCAKMKIDSLPRKTVRHEDSDEEEEQCALSENWQFQRSSRRWSRIPSPIPVQLLSNGGTTTKVTAPTSPTHKHLTPDEAAYSSSHDSVFVDEQSSSPECNKKLLSISYEDAIAPIPMDAEDIAILGCCQGSGSIPSCESDLGLEKSPDMLDVACPTLRRSGSERLKDSARALLRRMESLKGKRKKKQSQDSTVGGSSEMGIATPPSSTTGMEQQSPASSMTSSPRILHSQRNESAMSDDSPVVLDGSDGSQESTPQVKHRKRVWKLLGKNDATSGGDSTSSAACSDSECGGGGGGSGSGSTGSGFTRLWKNGNISEVQLIEQLMPTCDEAVLSNGVAEKERRGKTGRGGGGLTADSARNRPEGPHDTNHHSLQADKNSSSPERDGADSEERVSLYDNVPAGVPLVVFNRTYSVEQSAENDLLGKSWTGAGHSDPETHGSQEEVAGFSGRSERRDSGVGASLTRGYNCCQSAHVKWHCFPVSPPQRSSLSGPRSPSSLASNINALSALQLMMLRKRSLLKLTALMEKYSPSSRTGWNWAVPKFIRRIRAPDYKDKVVFGVPLLVNLQRTGQPLPSSIQSAIRHLRKTSLDSTGIFRKSGVRSRIQKLRNQHESNSETINYDNQQCYDVADMVKQYFRELPEALLTNKLSETFISIFQYIPEELRLQAIQACVLLMPDENREVLQSLLAFLCEVCEHSKENQMTASNLAVCFAPSLFHLTTPRSASASPRRRKTVGVPDQRELNENRAAHECLTRMITDYSKLFELPDDVLLSTRVSEQVDPATLDELGTCTVRGHCSWKAYVEGCIQALLKETREKLKGWVMVTNSDNTELSYKKVGDGIPLRLWKVSVDVEAPPVELLSRILRERHLWDESLLKWRLVTKLDKQSEVFQYVCGSLPPHPPRNYCVLRSWRTDLPKGTCVLIEASIGHPEAPILLDGIRGTVLASRYLIEPCGAGKSRVMHISRIDTRGRSPEWYNKAYGHIAMMLMVRLRDSFKHGTEGPETKV